MRTRTLIAAGLLGVAGFLTLAPPALAGETEGEGAGEVPEEIQHEAEEIAEANGAEAADVECIPILLEGGAVDDCQEAPNPILPATNELIWGAISFTVLLLLLRKFAWPGMKAGIEARTERIRSDLAGAESAGMVRTTMFLGIAFTEALALFGFVLSFIVAG